MKFSQALQAFYLARIADGVSKHTVGIYKWGLVPLCQFINDPDVSDITIQDLRQYMAFVIDTRGYSVSTLKMVHRVIGAFYTWATLEGLVEVRPDRLLKKPVGLGREVQPFSLEEVEKLIKACDYTRVADTQGNRRIFQMRRATSKRDCAIVLLLLDTGIRAGEMCRLNIRDVSLETGEVNILPFGSSRKSRPRTVYIGKLAKRALYLYLKERDKPDPHEPLFLSGDEMDIVRFTSNHVGKLIRRLGDRMGVKNAHPHRLRHTMAVQYLRNRGDPFTLKQLLGLSSWQIMQVYIQLSQSDLQEVHRSASPVDRWRL